MISIFKKILVLLTLRERKRFYVLFGVMLISGCIEVVGIVSIMPFLSLVTNPNLIQNNRIFNFFYTNLNFQNTNRYQIFIGIIVLIILIISNLLVFLTQYSLARF